jgi:phosphonate transport system substrate-binding protein
MVIAASVESGVGNIEDLKPGCRIALTENKDVKLIGLRLLEPADLTEALIEWMPVESYQAAARLAIKGEVEASFFLADAFASLTRMTRSQLRVLVQSAISDISHVVLAHPRMAESLPALEKAMLGLGQEARDDEMLSALGLPNGFEPMTQDEAEFMIDLMETLLD